jgi:hypothetical protein
VRFSRDLNLKFEFVWLVAPYFGCLFVGHRFCFGGEGLDFGDNCCFINRFKPAVNEVNGVSSSWKKDVLL